MLLIPYLIIDYGHSLEKTNRENLQAKEMLNRNISMIDKTDDSPLNCNVCLLSFVGDVGLTNDSINTIKNIKKHKPDAIFFAGDLSYSIPDDWFDLTKSLDNTKVFPALGNHETGYDSNDILHYPFENWLLPYGITNTYYSVTNDFIKVIIIDTELLENNNYEKFQQQKQFIINELDGNESDFEIIVMHRPIYSDQRIIDEYKKQLQPIFDKYKVELVIQAHNHSYQRYEPMLSNGIVDTDGQIYIVVGTGGRSLYQSGNDIDNQIIALAKPGILLLKLNNDIAYGSFVSNNGHVLDEFIIEKIEVKT